jgi:DNA-binding MarR family transcriptional regulator
MTLCKNEPLGRLIYYTAQDIRNMAEKILQPFDLTVEQMHLLKYMSVDTGLTQKGLGAMVNKSPANLTRILDRLEMKALIIRQPDPGDRRVYLVFLTDKGIALMQQVHETFQSFSSAMLQGISDEMQQIVKACLESMRVNIERMTLESEKDAP